MNHPKETPLLMAGELVWATLARLKTETRRPLKPQPMRTDVGWSWNWKPGLPAPSGAAWANGVPGLATDIIGEDCPFGRAGDRLWVRETHAFYEPYPCDGDGPLNPPRRIDEASTVMMRRWRNRVLYRATTPQPGWPARWLPSIHMPRWACRLVLPLAEVRVERLQDITEEGARAEGARAGVVGHAYHTALGCFQFTWDSIYGKQPGLGWDFNPWVWVLRWNADEILTGEAAAPGRAA